MRIISGSAGGLRLQTPASITRPTSDRVREALFSILASRVEGAQVLDLFAGSGALGLEALSRGAAGAVFVDHDRRACQIIQKNLDHTQLDGPHVKVWATEVVRFLEATAKNPPHLFDLVFADPPYVKKQTDRDAAGDLLNHPALPRMVNDQGVLILETATGWSPPAVTDWQLIDDRTYGGTRLWWWQRAVRLPDFNARAKAILGERPVSNVVLEPREERLW